MLWCLVSNIKFYLDRTVHRNYHTFKNALTVKGHRAVERDPSDPTFQSLASKYQHDPERSKMRMKMREERMRARESNGYAPRCDSKLDFLQACLLDLPFSSKQIVVVNLPEYYFMKKKSSMFAKKSETIAGFFHRVFVQHQKLDLPDSSV